MRVQGLLVWGVWMQGLWVLCPWMQVCGLGSVGEGLLG